MTMATNALKRELKAQLASQGFSIEVDRWPRKLTYYKQNGEAMPNMPADPVTMHRYVNVKGFTLAPPENLEPSLQEPDPEPIDTVTAVFTKDEEAEFEELVQAEELATASPLGVTSKDG